MKFGAQMGGPTAGEVARGLEAEGLEFVGVSDTQALAPDVYCLLTTIAATTKRIELGPWATNVLTRHPSVTAGAIATVDMLSGGRAFLNIGTGRSSTANAGMKPGTPEQLAEAVTVINSAFRPTREARSDIEWPEGLAIDEDVVPLPAWAARRVPILVSATGPKALRIAAEMGDGVVMSPGDVTLEGAAERVAQLKAWREAGPRAGQPFDISLNLRCHLTNSLEQGRAAMRNVVSAHAVYALPRDMPDDLRDAQRQYRAAYRWDHHGAFTDPVNPDAMDRLGLADHMYRRYAIIGDESVLISAIRTLEEAGVDAVANVPPAIAAAYRARAA
ncbi:MAG: LLM class flavin-dependent oxidoreductase [Phenylobacterium sp.]